MDFIEINKALRKNIETGKKLGLTTGGEKWWYIGIVRDKKTKEPVAFGAYYEPTDGVTGGLVKEQDPRDLINLKADLGLLMVSRLFSILLEGEDQDEYEFFDPVANGFKVDEKETTFPSNGNVLVVDDNMALEDSLAIMYASGAKTITGDERYGEWCKMTNSYVALKGNGKWFRYYFNNYRDSEGEPDFVRIAHMFYSDSGCRATKRCLAY